MNIFGLSEIDIDAIARISYETLNGIYSIDWTENAVTMFRQTNSNRIIVRVAKENNSVIGFCNLRSWLAGGWIDLIAIEKKYQGKGYGSLLLDDIVNQAQNKGYWKISLIVSENEISTIQFYKSNRFEIVGPMKDEIRKGENGLLMSRIIDYNLHPNNSNK
jgi:ribosomal protein S18 acetylase RimI-like enzyme